MGREDEGMNHSSKKASGYLPGILWYLAGGILLLISFLSVRPAHGATAGGWKFEWSDEFNGPAIDTSVWGYENGYVRNSELQYYTNRPENSRIDNGCLLIQALRDNWNGHTYTSASRRSMNKKSWLYGRFEMRAKIDVRQGSWPAWWWLPNTGGWPKGGEIDMMEFYQGKCLFNVMDGNQRWTSPTRTVAALGGAPWAAQFHVWTWEWDSLKIDLSLDGVLINHYPLSNADGTGSGGANPFRRPGYMLVNQAIGGVNGGDPSGTAFPVEYRIDWIRVHTWSNAAAHTLTINGGIGGGPYVAGTKASITAKLPPNGQIFDKWVMNAGNPAVDDSLSPSAQLTMPDSDVEVTATYKTGDGIRYLRQTVREKGNGASCKDMGAVYDVFGRKLALSGATVFSGKSRISAGVYIVAENGFSLQRIAIQR